MGKRDKIAYPFDDGYERSFNLNFALRRGKQAFAQEGQTADVL